MTWHPIESAKPLVWESATDHGQFLVSLPAKIEPCEVDEIQEMFALVMRGVRRRVDPSRHRKMIWNDVALPPPPSEGEK